MLELNIFSKAHLASAFGNLGASVGCRTGPDRRTHEEMEWWCLRRYAFTLAEVNELGFPISIVKGERPDFRCHSGSLLFGSEVAEATNWRDQVEMTAFERTGKPVLLGTHGGRFKRGAANPERAWKADVLRTVRAKSHSIIKFADPMPEYVLLLYSNSNAVMLTYDWPRVFKGMEGINVHIWKQAMPLIKRVAVICGNWLLVLGPSSVDYFPIRTGIDEQAA